MCKTQFSYMQQQLRQCSNPRNKSMGCMKWLPHSDFRVITSTRMTSMCTQCIDFYNQNTTIEHKITLSVRKANERCTQRGGGERLRCSAAVAAWTSKCNLCKKSISLHLPANDPMKAVIDRVNTNSNSYHDNFQWLCALCNKRKKQTSFHARFVAIPPTARLASAGHGKRMTATLFG